MPQYTIRVSQFHDIVVDAVNEAAAVEEALDAFDRMSIEESLPVPITRTIHVGPPDFPPPEG